ncbi:hypothetical protein [Streptomyces sp. NPDC056817]|uniref:hypothetical protein n=1 Tax=Streptomyces sp. NPDC056817 TaxID=3345950 RepID=UPI0036B4ECA1
MQLAPSALHATAETLGRNLGWTLNKLVIDDIVNLDGPHDRQIGMRLIGDGSNIQLWATGGTQPADHEPAEDIAPLPHGRRWHTWVHIGALEPDKDPGVVLYNAISDRLLPVFDTKPLYVGHRPWAEAFDTALSEVMAESTPTADPQAHTQPQDTGEDREPAPEPETAPAPEATPTPEPQAPAEPTAKVIPMRTRRPQPAADTADTPAADAAAKRPARKRTPAKPADTPASDAEAKPRPTRKRAPAKPATAAADGKAKRPARKRAAKPAADKPTT